MSRRSPRTTSSPDYREHESDPGDMDEDEDDTFEDDEYGQAPAGMEVDEEVEQLRGATSNMTVGDFTEAAFSSPTRPVIHQQAIALTSPPQPVGGKRAAATPTLLSPPHKPQQRLKGSTASSFGVGMPAHLGSPLRVGNRSSAIAALRQKYCEAAQAQADVQSKNEGNTDSERMARLATAAFAAGQKFDAAPSNEKLDMAVAATQMLEDLEKNEVAAAEREYTELARQYLTLRHTERHFAIFLEAMVDEFRRFPPSSHPDELARLRALVEDEENSLSKPSVGRGGSPGSMTSVGTPAQTSASAKRQDPPPPPTTRRMTRSSGSGGGKPESSSSSSKQGHGSTPSHERPQESSATGGGGGSSAGGESSASKSNTAKKPDRQGSKGKKGKTGKQQKGGDRSATPEAGGVADEGETDYDITPITRARTCWTQTTRSFTRRTGRQWGL